MKIKKLKILMLLCLFKNLDLLSMNDLVKNGTVEFFDDTNFLNENRKNRNILIVEDAQIFFKRQFVYNAIISQLNEPLTNAVESGNNAGVKLLLDLGAHAFIEKRGCPLIIFAARSGFSKMIISLTKNNKYLLDARDCHGKTSLIWAVHNGRENIVNIVIDLGANIFIQDFDGRTALDYASYQATLPGATEGIKNIHKKIKIEYSKFTAGFYENQDEDYNFEESKMVSSCIKTESDKKEKTRKKVRFADSADSSCSAPTTPEQICTNSK